MTSDDLADRAFKRALKMDTLLAHVPLVPVPANLQDMPIYELAAFPADSLDAYNAGAADHDHAYFYSRYANPTIGALEVQVARLEQAEASIVFASGMAAIAATLLSLLRTGDHVVVTDDLFVTTRELFTLELPRFGIDVSMVDPLDTPGIEAAMTARTRVIFAEVFSNPLLKVLDVTSVAQIAHARSALLVVDNTFLSPVLLRPLAYGADLVVHSATKFMAGHGTVLGGAVSGPADLIDAIAARRGRFGSVLGAHAAHTILLGLKTLGLRAGRQCENAWKVAEALEGHPAVEVVHYPGLQSHMRHELAGMLTGERFGSLMSFALKDRGRGHRLFYNSLRLVRRATSLGDVVSLVSNWEERGVMRLSVGIEDPGDIIDDLRQALEVAVS